MRTGAIFARGSCRALKWVAVMAAFAMLGSTQAAGQAAAPEFESAVFNGTTTVMVTMSEPVYAGGTLAASVFAIGGNAGTAHTVPTTPGAASATFTITFTSAVTTTGTLQYTAPTDNSSGGIQDASGVPLAASASIGATARPLVLGVQGHINVPMGLAMDPVELSMATGGVGTISYSIPAFNTANADPPVHVAGEVPPGLTFTAATRMLSGTATGAVGTRYQVNYTATDSESGTPQTDTLTFYVTVVQGTPPPAAVPTNGEITDISIDGAVEKNIDGKRMHVQEGDHTKVSVTILWEDDQLEELWKDVPEGGKPADAVVMIMAESITTGNPRWLSPAELNHDVNIGPGFQINVPIPKVPKTARYDDSTGSTQFTLGRDDDAEAEAFKLVVTNMSAFHEDSEDESADHVIEDSETQGIKLERDGKGVIYEGGDDVVFEVSADPALVDLSIEVRFDLDDVTGETVASRDNRLDVSSATIGPGRDEMESVTVTLDDNDSNRTDDTLKMMAEVVPYALDTGAYEGITSQEVDFTVVDVHKLPTLMVSPATGMVTEGEGIELTLTIDRNPANTIATDPETRQYTSEAIEVMLTMGAGTTAGMGDYELPATAKFEKHDGKAPWTQEMKVMVMASADDELDGGEMLVLDAMVAGTMAEYGSEKDSHAGVSMLTIEEGTMKLVSPKTDEEIQAVIYPAKEAGMGADMIFSPGEMIEVAPASALFNAAEGVTLSYSAMSDHDHVATTSVSGSTVTVTAGDEVGMAHITITAHASMPSGAKGLPQTDPREASIIFPVEVGLETLSFTLMGPEDMNLVEGSMVGGMVTATANRAVTADVTINLMRDRAMSSADDMDYTAEAITIEAGMMSGTTMVMATEDDMMENEGNMPEELVLYGMAADNAGEVMGEVKFYIWDAAVPALPIIAQLLLAGILGIGGYRRYLRRR